MNLKLHHPTHFSFSSTFHQRLFPSLTLAVLLTGIITPSNGAAFFDTSQDTWAFLSGYGQSIPGWGQTTERVETVDIVPRYSHLVFDRLGSGWYRGFHSTLVEIPLHAVVAPDTSAMVGVNILACYTFTAGTTWRPYIFGGGGPVYSFAEIPGMGADWNGNYQFAMGVERATEKERALLFEIRYHHISNAGTAEPNVPLNSIKFMMGVRF